MAKITFILEDTEDGAVYLNITETPREISKELKDKTLAERLALEVCDFIRDQADELEETTDDVH